MLLLERRAQRAIGWLNRPPIIGLGGYWLPPTFAMPGVMTTR
jgi:hypothetical protein